MPPDRHSGKETGSAETGHPEDSFLLASVLGGDEPALIKLMDRYDRLVRYTVLRLAADRCQKDPQWLDSVASETWAGFVQSVRRAADRPPKSVRAYLVQIARNQTISALRRAPVETVSLEPNLDGGETPIEADLAEPVDALARIEWLEALRTCLADLDEADRTLASQLPAITDRRWRDAACALGLSESTLRSRWDRVLGRLRACIRGKTRAECLAPERIANDI